MTVDDAELALVAALVRRDEPPYDLVCGGALREGARARRGRSVGFAYACVAIAPTSGSAHGTTEPTARNFDCTATPHCAGVEVAGRDRVRRDDHPYVSSVRSSSSRSAPLGRHEDARDLRPRERRLDLLGRRRADDDGRARSERLPQPLAVVDVVEHERLRDVELALDRELRHAAPGRAEPALSHTVTDSPGCDPLDRDAARRELLELVRRSGEDRERPPVAGHAALRAEQLDRDGGLARAHRVVVADRQDRDVGLVDAADQLHVAEDARVAGEVERLAVLGLDDDARRLAARTSRPAPSRSGTRS